MAKMIMAQSEAPAYERHLPWLYRVGGFGWGITRTLSDPQRYGPCANGYLITLPDGGLLLVDPGSARNVERIGENAAAAGLDIGGVDDVLLTHSHYDHGMGAARWQREQGARVHLTRVGAEFLARDDLRLVGHAVQPETEPFERYRVDHAVDDGEQFSIGGLQLTHYHLPGHTLDCGSYALRRGGLHVLLGGDVFFGPDGTGALGTIGWLNRLWLSKVLSYRKSLQRLHELLPIDVLVPGHGLVVVGRERVARCLQASLATVEALLGNPRLVSMFGVPTVEPGYPAAMLGR